jgi:hypothetical protein
MADSLLQFSEYRFYEALTLILSAWEFKKAFL